MRKNYIPGRSNVLSTNGIAASSQPLSSLEAISILKKGGVMAHMDVPLRNKELPAYMEWYRDWSTHFNHEPFWGALHDMDIKKPIIAGGFKKQNIFDEMIPDNPHGVWWAAGGQKV